MRYTSFKPEYCKRAEDFLAKGHGLDALGAEFGVIRKTIYNWREEFPEFAEAIDCGFARRQQMVEELLRENAITGKGGGPAAIFLAKNWAGMRDRTEIESNVRASVEIEDKHDPKLVSTVLEFENRLRDLIARKPDSSTDEQV